jgi:hypothetical protein
MLKPQVILAGIVVLGGITLAPAQDITKEQNKLLAKRAAEADAYRKLAEIVYGLQINSRTYVRDFVTESDDIRGEVDAFVKGVRLGTPTWYEDGSCEIPAEVTVAKVVETLRSAHDRYYKGDDIKTSDFESITRRIEKNVIKVVGTGAPRPDLPPDLPMGALEILGPPPAAAPKPPIPDLWVQVGAQARMMAMRAAEIDAKRRLAERIKGLRLTARTIVRDFVPESDVITTEMDAFLVGAETVSTYLHHDELIAEATVRVPTEQVITTIKTLCSRHYKGDDIKGHDIEDVVKTVVKKDFEATGMGVPPPQYIRRYNETAAVPVPDWAMGSLEAQGEGTDPAMDTPQGRLKAARAAELDAKRKLAERIGGLQLESRTLVRDFLAQHDEVAALVDAVLTGAMVTKTEFTADKAVVTVAVPGMEVWNAIREEPARPQRP